MITLRRGLQHDDVLTWVRILAKGVKPMTWTNAKGARRSWPANWPWPLLKVATFDDVVEAATEAWQASKSLVADGVVGPKTWGAAGFTTEATKEVSNGDIAFVPAKWFSQSNRQGFNLIVIHTAECGEHGKAAENVANYFATTSVKASAHYVVDVDSIVQCVREKDIAWHASDVNGRSLGIEHAGSAKQSAIDWGDDYSIAMLLRSAKFLAKKCAEQNIPVKKLSPSEVKAGAAGFCGHLDVTNAYHGGKGHWDPGPNFLWSWFLDQVKHFLGRHVEEALPTMPEDVLSEVAEKWVEVECAGQKWLVAPDYIPHVGIGEAERLSLAAHCELPTPELVDAIWRAADMKIDAAKMMRSDFVAWSQAEMMSKRVLEDQAQRIAKEIGGRPFKLLAGSHKDVIRTKDGRIGIYGFHTASGRAIQGPTPYFNHTLTWADYSQGLRLCKRA